MLSLIIAGGVSVAATSQTTEWPDIDNHTLRGEAIASSKVVCRNMWGTPMLPDGKGGYSLIARINDDFIAESLIIPPRATRGMVAYRPLPELEVETRSRALPAPPSILPSAPAPMPAASAIAAPPDAGTPPDAAAAPAPAAAEAPTF